MDDLSLVLGLFRKRGNVYRGVAVILVLPMIYGGIHLAAWSFAFSTWLETIFWRGSCLVVMTTVPSPLLYAYFDHWPDWVGSSRPFRYFIFSGFAAIFAFSRVFLVVESFISLRSVPVGAYWIPAWLQYIPHV